MAEVIVNEVAKYLDSLAATNTINDSLGTILSLGKNLFVVFEQPNIATCLTVLPYGGNPPNKDGYRQGGNFQIRLKARNIHSSLKGMQAIINTFHMNQNICASTNGVVEAIQSSPIVLGVEEGGEYILTVSNYKVRYIKL